jgi:hypothetical protein
MNCKNWGLHGGEYRSSELKVHMHISTLRPPRIWTLKMEAVRSSETFVSNHHTPRGNNSENHDFWKYFHVPLKCQLCLTQVLWSTLQSIAYIWYLHYRLWQIQSTVFLYWIRLTYTILVFAEWHKLGLLIHNVRGCIQKFPDWPPGAWTANVTALCH